MYSGNQYLWLLWIWMLTNTSVKTIATVTQTITFGYLSDGSPTSQQLYFGMKAAVDESNALGGANLCNRNLSLVTATTDTSYTTSLLVASNLVSSNGVIAFVSSYGEVANAVALALSQSLGIGNVGPINGSLSLRSSTTTSSSLSSDVVTIRGSYGDEVNALVNYVTTFRDMDGISMLWEPQS
jgi:ABC-type branched-subunit amino acid transport system substrate-binding protein